MNVTFFDVAGLRLLSAQSWERMASQFNIWIFSQKARMPKLSFVGPFLLFFFFFGLNAKLKVCIYFFYFFF